MNNQEGVIKFNCIYNKNNVVNSEMITDINAIRTKLFDMKMINAHNDGIGYGNISKRFGDTIIISGSGTGYKRLLSTDDYSMIYDYSIKDNTVYCKGLTEASSESLSHIAIYQKLKNINYVVHIHSLDLWNSMLNKYPTTNSKIEYGTPEMAVAIQDLLKNIHKTAGVIIMGGHTEGMLFFGEVLQDVISLINYSCTKYIM